MARPRGRKSDPNRPSLRFKQSEVERAIRAAQAMRLPIGRIEMILRLARYPSPPAFRPLSKFWGDPGQCHLRISNRRATETSSPAQTKPCGSD